MSVMRQEQRFISIHAPLAGCDGDRVLMPLYDINFNPRTPCGVRHKIDKENSRRGGFQSTHPLRGATGAAVVDIIAKTNFNPRTPCGVRHCKAGTAHGYGRFQSTHPLRGATMNTSAEINLIWHFNPRTPCGVRLYILCRQEARTADKGRTH